MASPLATPERVWWKPPGLLEKTWVRIAFVWCLFLTAMMPLWFLMGKQNVPAESYRIDPPAFQERVMAFAEQYKVGEERGIPVVEPPPGSDVYLLARMFQWYPILKLKVGETYRLHASSLDVQHGLSIQPLNINFQLLPGYVHVITITPTRAGEYSLVCNEYCGLGHHIMVSKIIVTD